jgi:hypothetical protein
MHSSWSGPTFQRCSLPPSLGRWIFLKPVRTSETSVYLNKVTQPNIPEGCHLHTCSSDNLKSKFEKVKSLDIPHLLHCNVWLCVCSFRKHTQTDFSSHFLLALLLTPPLLWVCTYTFHLAFCPLASIERDLSILLILLDIICHFVVTQVNISLEDVKVPGGASNVVYDTMTCLFSVHKFAFRGSFSMAGRMTQSLL